MKAENEAPTTTPEDPLTTLDCGRRVLTVVTADGTREQVTFRRPGLRAFQGILSQTDPCARAAAFIERRANGQPVTPDWIDSLAADSQLSILREGEAYMGDPFVDYQRYQAQAYRRLQDPAVTAAVRELLAGLTSSPGSATAATPSTPSSTGRPA